jgi:hypothetical protein
MPKQQISEDLKYHIDNNIPVSETVFRFGSKKFFDVINEARELYTQGFYFNAQDQFILETDLGQFAEYEGVYVPLDLVMEELDEIHESEYKGKDVELGKPKRGGSKKFYVYVRDPKTKNVKKVAFGAKDGGGSLAVKFKNPKRRKAFADRHNCKDKKDKTSPGYWSCRLPRYAKTLGLGNNMNTYW